MSIFDLIPLRRKRYGRQDAADMRTATVPSRTLAPPRREYDPAIRAQAAAIVARAEAEAAAAREAAATQAWGGWDQPGDPAPLIPVPAAHEPPPMPPSDLSRIMVSQIPAPPPGDLSYDQSHRYAEYLRKIGAATGTSSSLEDTGMWALPALEPGDGTGVAL